MTNQNFQDFHSFLYFKILMILFLCGTRQIANQSTVNNSSDTTLASQVLALSENKKQLHYNEQLHRPSFIQTLMYNHFRPVIQKKLNGGMKHFIGCK